MRRWHRATKATADSARAEYHINLKWHSLTNDATNPAIWHQSKLRSLDVGRIMIDVDPHNHTHYTLADVFSLLP